MTNQDFTSHFLVDQTPEQVFKAICNVRGWWSAQIDGHTDAPGAVFQYRYRDRHRCTIKIVELLSDQKVVWQVLDNHFPFTRDQTEWTGTTIHFAIEPKDGRTEVRFTHVGLTPQYECYDICSAGWSRYINGSLYQLITTGKGQPNVSEAITARATAPA